MNSYELRLALNAAGMARRPGVGPGDRTGSPSCPLSQSQQPAQLPTSTKPTSWLAASSWQGLCDPETPRGSVLSAWGKEGVRGHGPGRACEPVSEALVPRTLGRMFCIPLSLGWNPKS